MHVAGGVGEVRPSRHKQGFLILRAGVLWGASILGTHRKHHILQFLLRTIFPVCLLTVSSNSLPSVSSLMSHFNYPPCYPFLYLLNSHLLMSPSSSYSTSFSTKPPPNFFLKKKPAKNYETNMTFADYHIVHSSWLLYSLPQRSVFTI